MQVPAIPPTYLLLKEGQPLRAQTQRGGGRNAGAERGRDERRRLLLLLRGARRRLPRVLRAIHSVAVALPLAGCSRRRHAGAAQRGRAQLLLQHLGTHGRQAFAQRHQLGPQLPQRLLERAAGVQGACLSSERPPCPSPVCKAAVRLTHLLLVGLIRRCCQLLVTQPAQERQGEALAVGARRPRRQRAVVQPAQLRQKLLHCEGGMRHGMSVTSQAWSERQGAAGRETQCSSAAPCNRWRHVPPHCVAFARKHAASFWDVRVRGRLRHMGCDGQGLRRPWLAAQAG